MTHSLKLLAFKVIFSSVEFIMSLQFYEPKNKPSKKDNLNPMVTHICKVDDEDKDTEAGEPAQRTRALSAFAGTLV